MQTFDLFKLQKNNTYEIQERQTLHFWKKSIYFKVDLSNFSIVLPEVLNLPVDVLIGPKPVAARLPIPNQAVNSLEYFKTWHYAFENRTGVWYCQ